MTSSNYRHNLTAILADYVLFGAGISFIGVSTVLPAFVRNFTDSPLIIGMVNTVWNGGWLIPQLAAANALNHLPRKKGALLRTGALGRPAMLIIALALIMGLWQRPGWMLVAFFASLTLFWAADAFCSIAWFDIIGKTIPANRRGRMFGAGQIMSSVLAIGIGAFVRWILSPQGLAFPSNYAWLFGLASVSCLLGLAMLATIREPLEDVPEERTSWRDYFPQLVKILREQPAYRSVIAAWLLSGLATLASPFYVLYATDKLGLAPETIGVFIIAQTVGGVLASFGFGALAERRGPGAVIRVTVAATISGPLVALAFHFVRAARELTLVYAWVFVVLGIINSAMMLGWMNYVLELAPPGHRPTYMGLSNTLGGLLVLVPMLGGWLLEATSYLVLFAAAAVGPALAWVIAMRLPASPASKEPGKD
jgi:MFS family permease